MNLSLVLLLKWIEMLRKCGSMGVVGICSLYIVWRHDFFFFFEIRRFVNLNYYKSFILILLNGINVSENEFLSSMTWLSIASTFQSPSTSKLSNPALPPSSNYYLNNILQFP